MTPNPQDRPESEVPTIGPEASSTASDPGPYFPQEGWEPVTGEDEAPPPFEEPHPGTEGPPAPDQSETEDAPEFDPRFRQDFEGLLYLGYLPGEFKWLGHSFNIRTLNTEDIIEVGLLHKQYADSLADIKAYQSLVVAACMVKLDGRPLATPLSNDPADTALSNNWPIVKKWYPLTIDKVYQEYLLLEARVQEVVQAMGKASG